MTFLPPGRYYIGDPGYVFSPRSWDKIVDKVLAYDGDVFEATVDDRSGLIYSASTAFGDGGFEGSDGKVYAVDAGILGAVSESLIEDTGKAAQLGRMVDAPGGLGAKGEDGFFTFSIRSADGVIETLTIDTDPGIADEDD